MIRVLHIHTLPIISGSGINTFLTMRGMHGKGYAAELACAPGGPLIDLVESHGMKVIPFRHLVQPLRPLCDLRALAKLAVYLRRVPYHIVHTHNSKAGFVGRLAARIAGIPVIVHTVHGFAFHDQESCLRKCLFRVLERAASHWCDRMIFISQPLIDWALREKVTVEEKTVKIYSGIELSRFLPVPEAERARLRKKWGIGTEDLVIGMVSKLWEGKGHVTLIKAFQGLREEMGNTRLVIAGEGYLRQSLVKQVERMGLAGSVLFTGFLSNPAEIIAVFDVAVLPSLFEGMGRVLLEAMAMEKPVVASRTGGIPDLVEHGVNGFLVNPGDVSDLRAALSKILKDRNLALRMGREGRKRIGNDFSADQMVRSIDQLYRGLLRMKGVSCDG
ncbi:MAG: glycosyltransferase family 4 protein [Deltaproteobacteria bacterium]|nr:glycosyltransferase family 4 protein [Deltaproteobacteria bacterium]